jgi:hypothetical protein
MNEFQVGAVVMMYHTDEYVGENPPGMRSNWEDSV